ncbi:TIGR02444 family protein [Dongia sp.]|uniref:TIGR02444 family protein n=1 Tax=Dongia sp. TaxID=1977262 RepID=UPI0035B19C47
MNPDDFWEFSLALYCREAVANACLSLQERRGADVNLILAICWLARSGYAVRETAIESALAAIAPWSEAILRPMRTIRRRLGAEFAEVGANQRQSIKHGLLSVELEAERISQQKIVAVMADHLDGLSTEPARGLAAVGLDLYLARLAAENHAQDRADRDAILAGL